MAVVTRTRRPPLKDVLLGTSRRRRRAGYVALGAAFKLLQPTLRRLAGAAVAMLVLFSFVVLWLAVRFSR